jgi:hypothetical protein
VARIVPVIPRLGPQPGQTLDRGRDLSDQGLVSVDRMPGGQAVAEDPGLHCDIGQGDRIRRGDLLVEPIGFGVQVPGPRLEVLQGCRRATASEPTASKERLLLDPRFSN